ncbi:hypothetical protein [Lentibacillus sp. JNUCC-1]|nr:hypothetical protein [Lentibacillus sp. JNUCC-1]
MRSTAQVSYKITHKAEKHKVGGFSFERAVAVDISREMTGRMSIRG